MALLPLPTLAKPVWGHRTSPLQSRMLTLEAAGVRDPPQESPHSDALVRGSGQPPFEAASTADRGRCH
eukprot:CAMPEP_0179117726 /NCGR_PEP_ID=MMETSP0796-20121207/55313_1 /TAXON_ID=73915 /ORGANISM="Pyrodinium bahamense, Strain pbaha01" /LENGTH=67 /DNA_ID=CAMNT_0020816115 /DNA_START=83 /DNA_END=284 /DNA_ORIENTATION=-